MTTTTALVNQILTAQGRQVRPAQRLAAEVIDTPGNHKSFLAPTGSGKSVIAIAAALANEGMVAMHSNGLVSQYIGEIPAWEAATGKRIAVLVGKKHYLCRKSRNIDAFDTVFTPGSPERAAFDKNDGTFIGTGVTPDLYAQFSVLNAGAEPISDDMELDLSELSAGDFFEKYGQTKASARAKDPCNSCSFRDSGCPLWNARRRAQDADAVVTNASLGAILFFSGNESGWTANLPKKTLVLDEAHADVEPISRILGRQITIKRSHVKANPDLFDALAEDKQAAFDWATRHLDNGADFARYVQGNGGLSCVSVEVTTKKITLSSPADLKVAFQRRNVIAMSGTMSTSTVEALGLNCDLVSLPGLDLSASEVVSVPFPAWKWQQTNPADHMAWTLRVAEEITQAGGRTIVLFVSIADMEAVLKVLPADVRNKTIQYHSKVDRVKAVERYKSDPANSILVGCAAGLGTGVDLPNDLCRTVIITRVPQFAPKGAVQQTWTDDSRSNVIQSVGRGHRNETDWCKVRVLGGFGRRNDIVDGLKELGWNVK